MWAALSNIKWEDSLGKSPAVEKDDWNETLSEAKDLLMY